MSLITWTNGSIEVTTNGTIRTTEGKIKGKFYWEVEITKGSTDDYMGVGITSKDGLSPTIGRNIHFYGIGQLRLCNGNYQNTTNSQIYKRGDVVAVLLDLDNDNLTFMVNGEIKFESLYKPSQTGNVGEFYPYVLTNGGANFTTFTANFGATPFNYPTPKGYLPYDYENASWFSKNKYLIQDNDKIKKPTMEGLQEVGNIPVTLEMFKQYGTEYLPDIIGQYNKDVDMVYKEDLEDMKLFRYKLVGYADITKLENKAGD